MASNDDASASVDDDCDWNNREERDWDTDSAGADNADVTLFDSFATAAAAAANDELAITAVLACAPPRDFCCLASLFHLQQP